MRIVTMIAIAGVAVLAVTAPGQANDRYRSRPPVLVSPDLSAPWVMQLRRTPDGGRNLGPVMRPVEPDPDRAVYRAAKRQQIERQRAEQLQTRRQQAVRGEDMRTAAVAAPKPRKTATPQMDPKFLPAVIDYDGSQKPGTIVIDTNERYLYLVEEGGKHAHTHGNIAATCLVVACLVMTIARVTATDQHTVRTIDQWLQYVHRVNRAAAHHPYHTHIRRILQA